MVVEPNGPKLGSLGHPVRSDFRQILYFQNGWSRSETDQNLNLLVLNVYMVLLTVKCSRWHEVI